MRVVVPAGQPATARELEALVVRMATENRDWGYVRIQGALSNLGHELARGTIANILKRNAIEPAPERVRKTTWKEFLTQHWEQIVAADFFTVEVWTRKGLRRFMVLFFIELSTRRVQIAAISAKANGLWMNQIARNLTDAVGFGSLGPMSGAISANIGMYGPPRVCKRKLLMAIGSAQMYSGLCRDLRSLAMMGFRPLSPLLAMWPWLAATDIRFRKRRYDRCANFVIRQQTWREFLFQSESLSSGCWDRAAVGFVLKEDCPRRSHELVRQRDHNHVLRRTTH